MNSRLIRSFAALAVVSGLVAVSCAKEAPVIVPDPAAVPTEPDETGEVPVLFTSDLFEASVETKATEVTTANLTSINVTAVGDAGGFTNQAFSLSGGVYSGGQYWPATDAHYVFYASNVALQSGNSVSASNATDVVCAVKADAAYKATNALQFEHIFARVGYCRVSAPAGYTVSNFHVDIVPLTSGTYSLAAGNGKTDRTGWSGWPNGTNTVLVNALNSTADTGLYLIPGDYELKASYRIEKGAYVENVVDKTCTVSLVKGKRNNITASLPAGSAADLTFTVSVTPWSDQAVNASF